MTAPGGRHGDGGDRATSGSGRRERIVSRDGGARRHNSSSGGESGGKDRGDGGDRDGNLGFGAGCDVLFCSLLHP